MSKTVFITGATAGFGKAMAEKFAGAGYRLIICGRRKERLENLSAELKNKFNVEIISLSFDVRNYDEVKNAIATLSLDEKKIDVLINNAGLASGFDFIQEGNIDDWHKMIDTNIKGLLFVTREIAPLMIARGSGHIINIGSTAAKYAYEKGNVYSATKFAVDSLSQGMRIDMLKQNIRVTAIHPGAAETEFSVVRFHGDEEKAKNVYKGFEPLHAEDVADVALYVASLPAHVCINELVMTPTAQASPYYINRKS